MGFNRCHGRVAVTICLALLVLAGCARSGQDEMSWARSALERNGKIEIVATDPQSRTFTVRQKDTGELRMVRADELIGGAAAPAQGAASPVAATASPAVSGPATTTATTTATEQPPAATAAGSAAWVSEPAPAEPAPVSAPAAQGAGGRVLEAGPGYSIKAAAVAAEGGAGAREASVTTAAVERRHEPIICQGSRMLQIDNRNLVFDGDAVSAEDGCEIHITNSHISASGVGVSARAANVHIDNSQIEGGAASIDASEGAQVYAESSRFHGMSRRLDTAGLHDLGGNVWN
jgi:hypothetical protein